ncbi:putative hydroxypyruvate isomerase isoform X2 [Corticium candelabrum]|uniref:putative hydroxypyruvate isomerase isoform X2 n=1 Tax=Corticium candelabrum TaxID=121492 RepID=UPI002E25E50F|nr:putative hydroxypyruvate isomerase isoform X2 [Corticium candelabrum]
MSKFKLAANLAFLFTEKPLLERFLAAKASGFVGVELGFPYDVPVEKLVQARDKAHVEIALISMPPGNWDDGDRGLAAIPNRQEEFRESVTTAVQYASALKCKRLHCLAGLLPENCTDSVRAEYEATYIENLRYAADILQQDIFHAQSTDGNLTSFFDANKQFMGHVQVGQVPGRHEPDSHGEVNFPFLFNHLERNGYDAWIGCEYHPKGCTEDGLEWAAPYLKHQQ